MDTFVKHFTSGVDGAGVKMLFEAGPVVNTFLTGQLSVKIADRLQRPKNRTMLQPMTPAGFMEANITGDASSLDGINRELVTPEGQFAMSRFADIFRPISGMKTDEYSKMLIKIGDWRWMDNHVALLINMWRYVVLRAIEEQVGSLDTCLGVLDDDMVRVDLDQFWTDAYPEAASFDSWPADPEDRKSYPAISLLNVHAPDDEHDAIDLRTLNNEQARFVLLMLGSWTRRSRIRLDFSTPRLTNAVHYRCDLPQGVEGYTSWLQDETGVVAAPRMLSSVEAWEALRKYIVQNRLYDHFSTAMYMVGAAMYQFKPDTPEGAYWLKMQWKLSYPRFHSMRGRFSFVNAGDAALVSHRALHEWQFLANSIDKFNLLALLQAQAFQTGLALRSVRHATETNPTDLYTSANSLYHTDNLYAGAMSEACRFDVPLPGMTGTYIWVDEKFETCDSRRKVAVTVTGDAPEYYHKMVKHTEPPREVEKFLKLTELSKYSSTVESDVKARWDQLYKAAKAKVAAVRTSKAGVARTTATTQVAVSAAEAGLSEDEAEALKFRVRTVVTVQDTNNYLAVPWMVFAGVPLLLLPLDIFPYSSPFLLKGKFGKDNAIERNTGIELNNHDAWNLAAFTGLCGYDTIMEAYGTIGPKEYYAHPQSNFVWPILFAEDEQMNTVLLTDLECDFDPLVKLPNLYSTLASGPDVSYEFHMIDRGVGGATRNLQHRVAPCGTSVSIIKPSKLTFTISDQVVRMRGYISRQESGFRYVPYAQAGVIPQLEGESSAPGAEGQ